MSIRVVVVCPVLNQAFYTKQFLKSLDKQVFKDFAVVIVDNGSTDETPDFLKTIWCPISDTRHVIYNETNRGYAGGCNDGINLARKIYPDADVLICNNDMELLPECISELVKVVDTVKPDLRVGILGGRLLFPDGRIQHAGAFLNVHGWGQHKLAGVLDSQWKEKNVSLQEYVTGALFFITNTCLQHLPGFDEQFSPAYFEEVDYCTSARKLGFYTYYVPTAKAIHYENKTALGVFGDSNKVQLLSRRNQIKYYVKHDTGVDDYTPSSDLKALITGKIYGDWSFSIVLRNLAKGLSHNGVDVTIAPEEYHLAQSMEDSEIQAMIKKPYDYWNRVVMRSSEGDHQYIMPPGKKRIAHTTFEGTNLHHGWIDQLNHVDEVVVNSTFCKNILTERGVKTRVSVIPNPVDMRSYHPNVPPMVVEGRRKFSFLFVSAFGERKNLETLIRAFILEFKEKEDVQLQIHSLSWFYILQQMGTDVKTWVNDIVMGGQHIAHAPIIPTSMSLHPAVLPSLYTANQCLVFPSRCEGFGNALVEAAACGVPAIATNYSGMSDWISNTDTGYPVNAYKLSDIPLQVLPYFRNYVGSVWADIDIDALRVQMRYVFEHQEEAQRKGMAAYERAKQYDIDAVGKQLKSIMFD